VATKTSAIAGGALTDNMEFEMDQGVRKFPAPSHSCHVEFFLGILGALVK
jgi:hypothetical protein